MDKGLTYPHGLATIVPESETQAPMQAYFTPPKAKNYPARWLLLWQDESEVGLSMTEQAKMEKPLTQTEYRVRDYIMGTIGIGNFVYVNQAEVARELRLDRAKVCHAIKRLISLGILICGPKSGRSNTYMVSPVFCFSGGLGHGIKERRAAIGRAKVTPFQKEIV